MSLEGRGRTAAALSILVLVAAGCGSPVAVHELGTQSDLEFLDGLVLSDRTVVAVPDGRWGDTANDGTWSFRGSARFYCLIREVPDGEVVFLFTPDDTTAEFRFTVAWDDTPIFEEPQLPSYGENRVVIPPRLVTPGLHTLTVDRVGSLDPPHLSHEKNNRFEAVAYSVGDELHPFDSSDVDRYWYTAMLVARGVTGATPQKLSGCLFDGPRALTATLDLGQPATVSFVAENNSRSASVFSVTVGGHSGSKSVKAGDRESIAVNVPAGSHHLSLEVDGHGRGQFLWGAPTIRRRDGGGGTPIVLVTLDTTRRDALSPWGGPAVASPEIEKLAGQGVVFDSAWSVGPWTLPTHASIFTGLYPYRHGAGVWEDHLGLGFDTLADLLSQQGYYSAGFAGGALSAAQFGVAQGFHRYLDPDGFETPADLLVDAVEKLLDSDVAGPLFLFVNLFDPHAIYQAPEEFERRFNVAEHRSKVDQLPVWNELTRGSIDAWRRLIVGEGELTPEAMDYLRAAYLAEVAFMDSQIGRLLTLLRERGLFDPALIVLVADHGELLGEGGFVSHCCRLDTELVQLPLIIKWPGQHEPGRVRGLVSQVDLFSTMLEAAGIDVPPRDGLPLAPMGRDFLEQRRTVFMEEHESRVHPLFANMTIAPHIYGIQELAWRETVWAGGSSCESGTRGTWRSAPCGIGWEERMQWLQNLAELPMDRGVSEHDMELSDDERQRLEALGYIQ